MPKQEQRRKVTAREVIRLFKLVQEKEPKEIITITRDKLIKKVYAREYYVNRAFTEDGNYYECITFSKPTTAILETSPTKWGPSRGKVSNLEEHVSNLIDNFKWKKIKPETIGSRIDPQRRYRAKQEREAKEVKEFNQLVNQIEFTRIARLQRQSKIASIQKIEAQAQESREKVLTEHEMELQRALDFQRAEKEKLDAKIRPAKRT